MNGLSDRLSLWTVANGIIFAGVHSPPAQAPPQNSKSFWPDGILERVCLGVWSISEICQEQLQQLKQIASRYPNLQCSACAEEIQAYLVSQNIPGKRIKLFTGDSVNRDAFIYDDSADENPISVNGRHEGISITIEGSEIIFDNHHAEGIERERWMANLLFVTRLHHGAAFQITEVEF